MKRVLAALATNLIVTGTGDDGQDEPVAGELVRAGPTGAGRQQLLPIGRHRQRARAKCDDSRRGFGQFLGVCFYLPKLAPPRSLRYWPS